MAQQRRVIIRNHTAEANLFARRALISFIGVLVMILILPQNLQKKMVHAILQKH